MVLNTDTGVLHQILSYLDIFPEGSIAIVTYIGGVILTLLAWYFITKPYPKFCAISTLVLFAIIATPTVSEGSNAALAPAICAVLFGTLTHDHALVVLNLACMLFVVGLGLLVAYCWNKFILQRKNAT